MDNSIADLMNNTVFHDELNGANDQDSNMNQTIKERKKNKNLFVVSQTSSPQPLS